MKVLSGVLNVLLGICGLGISLLFLYVEWLYIRESFVNFLNPFLQLDILVTLITMPLFWVLAVVGLMSGVAMNYADKHTEPRRPAEPVRSAKSTRSTKPVRLTKSTKATKSTRSRKTASVTKRTSKSSRPTKGSFEE